MDGMVALHILKTFACHRLGIHGLLHHTVAKEDFVAKVG